MANAEIASTVVSVVCLKQGLLSEVVYFLSLPFPVVEMNFYTGHRSTQCLSHYMCSQVLRTSGRSIVFVMVVLKSSV